MNFVKGEGIVVITLEAFVEGGNRILMSKLLTNFLRHFKLCTDQCTPNIFRVVSSIAELDGRLSLNLIGDDINFVCSFQDSKILGFYFKTWEGN